jgi:hypothetical protein
MVRVQHPAQLRLDPSRLLGHLGLTPGVLHLEHEVADHLAVPHDHDRLGEALGLLEVAPVLLQRGRRSGEPAADVLPAADPPGGLEVLDGGGTEGEPVGADRPGHGFERGGHADIVALPGSDRDQVDAEVAHLGDQPVQLRLVGHRAAEAGGAVIRVVELEGAEPGRPALVEVALDPELVAGALPRSAEHGHRAPAGDGVEAGDVVAAVCLVRFQSE